MDAYDDAYTQTELELNIKTHNCAALLKKRGYSVLTKNEFQKNAQFKAILITLICTLMLIVGVILGVTLS